MDATATPTPPKTAKERQQATHFQPKHDRVALLAAYHLHRAQDAGTVADFCSRQDIPTATFYTILKEWRENASKGLHPNTGQPVENAGEVAQMLGLDPHAIDEPESGEDGQDRESEGGGGFQKNSSLSKLRRQAERIYRRALAGEKVSPTQARMASELLRADLRDDTRDKVSEFASWPADALRGLIAEVAPEALATRAEPKMPALTAAELQDEPDASRAVMAPAVEVKRSATSDATASQDTSESGAKAAEVEAQGMGGEAGG